MELTQHVGEIAGSYDEQVLSFLTPSFVKCCDAAFFAILVNSNFCFAVGDQVFD